MSASFYFVPDGWTAPDRAALAVAGGPCGAMRCRVFERRGDGAVGAVGILDLDPDSTPAGPPPGFDDWRTRVARPRADFAGLRLDRPRVMAILNVTPDSFSDGGQHAGTGCAIEAGRAMVAAGADIVDVGGESTRPGAAEVTADIECERVVPVVEALAADGALVSIDTRHAATMRAAVAAGARVVNDVSALRHDPESLAVVADSDAAVVLMHMRGTPATMTAETDYDDVRFDVYDALARRVETCVEAGIMNDRIAVDPGIGFAKTPAQNLALLRDVALFHGLGCAVLIGASRKLRLGPAESKPARNRLGGSLAAALHAAARGVQLLRVHDVAETVEALSVQAMVKAADDARSRGATRGGE